MCSVTLRRHKIDDVVRVAASAGLSCVEWGADRHVPPGDATAADRARDACAEAGLRVSSYGSYFRAGVHDAASFAPVLASARRLGAPRIRIWAGDQGSGRATAQWRDAVVRTSRLVAEQAADGGVSVAFEFHGGTLTDDSASTLALLDDIDHASVGTYWQPPVGVPDDVALDGLRIVLPHVAAVHVFSWWPGEHRRPLPARAAMWRRAFDSLRTAGRDVDALLEFVPGDDADVVGREARALAELTGS